jgi:hypothetical protein
VPPIQRRRPRLMPGAHQASRENGEAIMDGVRRVWIERGEVFLDGQWKQRVEGRQASILSPWNEPAPGTLRNASSLRGLPVSTGTHDAQHWARRSASDLIAAVCIGRDHS